MPITRVVLLLSLLFLVPIGGSQRSTALAAGVQAPVLKWQRGGCYSSWCETGWYASPAVADLDGDGTMEVLGAAYSLFVMNGENGTLQFRVDTAGDRVWPGVVVADIDHNGDLEIVMAQGGGYVTVLDQAGNIVWSRQPTSSELRGLAVYDLDQDGTLDIIVTEAASGQENTWIYNSAGVLRAGWPQLDNTSGYAAGVYNSNAAVHDLDKDGKAELIVPSDVHYLCAYDSDGVQIPAHTMYGGKGWGLVGVWESLATELRGWGTCSAGDARAERYRTNFAHGASVIADVNGDGTFEVVVTGNVYDCAVGHPPGKYNGVYLLNADRSRFNRGGYDWRRVPLNTGAPLSEDYAVIENNQPNPVVADLDGDGKKEILYASYDGRVHAFWLDKTEHGAWPYSVYQATEGVVRFASEPVVADLNNDGYAEVLFTSWVQKGTGKTGKLHVLNWQGQLLHEVRLPLPFGGEDWNGGLAAPTLANIDGDADLEVVVNTAHSGFVAYDLPGTAKARILWGTGRGNFQRTGTASPGPLPVVTITAADAQAAEAGSDRGLFTLTRTGNTSAALAVRLTVAGSATNGTDYQALPAVKIIPAGRAAVSLALVPVDDTVSEGTEVVAVRIASSDAYIVGAAAVARVNLVDND